MAEVWLAELFVANIPREEISADSRLYIYDRMTNVDQVKQVVSNVLLQLLC